MRDFRLFAVRDDDHEDKLYVPAIHGRKRLSPGAANLWPEQYNLGSREPRYPGVVGGRAATTSLTPYSTPSTTAAFGAQ